MDDAYRGPATRNQRLQILNKMIRDQDLGTDRQAWFFRKLFERTAHDGPAESLSKFCLHDFAQALFLLHHKKVIWWLSQETFAHVLSQRLQREAHVSRKLDALIDQFIKVMRLDEWRA